MSIEENKSIARRFSQIWGRGSIDLIDKLAAPSLTVDYPVMPEVIRGADVFRQLIERFRLCFPDAELRVEEEIAEADNVVTCWSFSGTHRSTFMGIPATGKKVRWTGITMYRIIDGRIVQEKGEGDYLGFLHQVGAAL